MSDTPSEYRPKFRRRDLLKWPHLLVRAIWELARARIAFGDVGPAEVKRLNASSIERASRRAQNTSDIMVISRIGFVISIVSRHVPWRSDCLPQALAGQRWLLSKGFASEIRVGVERPEDGEFGAHAWLVHEESVVTGGEIGNFAVLLSNNISGNDSS